MKNIVGRNQNRWRRAWKLFFILQSLSFISWCRAEDFGDISVAPNAIYTGNTFHGYAETRVVLENHSPTKAHTVTVVTPNRSWENGNAISRLARTVTLAPGAHEIVSLLQPPLPLDGDGLLRVEVDGREEGQINTPNARAHCSTYSYGGRNNAPTVLVSRSLDFDAVNTAMQPGMAAGTATGTSSLVSHAVGEPGAWRSGHKDLAAAWMPSFRAGSRTDNWLEVDYAPTQNVSGLVIHSLQAPLTSGTVTVIGTAGTNLLTLAMTTAQNIPEPSGHGWNVRFSFPATKEPVKTVKIDFGQTRPMLIAVDGVQITGPTGNQWANNARASSENFSMSPPPRYIGGATPADNIQCLRAESPVSEWSENWLAYTPFDTIVLDATDLRTMPPAVFNALGDYLFAGGNVILSGQADLPAAWQSSRKESLPSADKYQIGFGQCLVFPAENAFTLFTSSIQTARDLTRDSARYWAALPDNNEAANTLFPVVNSLKIPTRGIVVIMLAFVILIGPVNIILLNRRKRRTWMLWTIPAISFATTLLVFAYSLLREGITPDTRIAGLTVLDQVHHHAATVGVTAFYCPLTPSGGLKFDFGTEATALVHSGYGPGNSREVDWTQLQHFQRGWVSARVPAHFHLRKSETRRERIQVVKENGKLQVVNSLGGAIKSLWFADADMNIYEVHDVAAGQKNELNRTTQLHSSEHSSAADLLRQIGFTASPDPLKGSATSYLSPNTYIAVLDNNPFIENALSSATPKRTKSSAVVLGILAPEDQ